MQTEKKISQKNSLMSLFVDQLAMRISDPRKAALGRKEQLDVIYANLSTVILWNILAGFLTVLAFVGQPQFLDAVFWYCGFLLTIGLLSMGGIKRYLAVKVFGATNSDHPQMVLAFVFGLAWVAMPMLVFNEAKVEQQLFVTMTMVCIMGIGAFFWAGVPRAAIVFLITLMVGITAAIFLSWHSALLNSVMLVIAFTLLVIGMIRENSSFLVERLAAKLALVESNDVISVLLQEHEDRGYEWLWETDARGNIVNASKKFAEAAGVSLENLNENSFKSLFLGFPDNCSSPRNTEHNGICDAFSAKQPFRDVIVKYLHPNGETRFWKLSGRPVSDLIDQSGDPSGNYCAGYRGVALDITDAKISEDKIAYLALYDSLTDLPNRANFNEQIDEMIDRTNSEFLRFGLFFLDLDKFKHINDTLGHLAADTLLILVSKRLNASCANAKIIARLGGDEFAIVAEDISSIEEAKLFAKQIVSCFDKPFNISERIIKVTCSVGVALAPCHARNPEDLIRHADLALFRAKKERSSSCNIFEADMDLQVRERRLLSEELKEAINNQELFLLYQPLFAAKTNEICGYEALVRWRNPRCGLVSPEQFIPIAEEDGMIVEIGKWVIHQACREAGNWGNLRRVAVNLSPLQFVGIQLESVVTRALADSGLSPSRLELEITENSLMVDKVATLQTLKNLRHLGVSIALDDFGTGYSSLSYLMSYPFDKLKIDRSFLSSEVGMGHNETLIRTIIGLAKNLNMRTTAEGVETVEHLEFLTREGVDEIQGYLISEPLSPEEIEASEDDRRLVANLGG